MGINIFTMQPCSSCNGKSGCEYCQHTGRVQNTSTHTICCPPAVKHNHVVDCDGGIRVLVKHNDRIRKNKMIRGDDIHISIPITLPELLKGFRTTITIPNIDSSVIQIIKKGYFNPEKTVDRFPGYGVTGNGDLVATYKVTFPENADETTASISNFVCKKTSR